MCLHGRLLGVARISCPSLSPCFRGAGSTLCQRRYLPGCVTKGFPTSALFSQIIRGSYVVGKERNSQIIVNLVATNVPRCAGSIVKTVGFKHLHFPDMGTISGPLHRTDELLVKHKSTRDGKTTFIIFMFVPCILINQYLLLHQQMRT